MHRSKDNPDGYTVLAVAENRQSVDLMQERMARTAPVPRQAFFYDSFQGVERFRKALVNMLTNTFMKVGRSTAPMRGLPTRLRQQKECSDCVTHDMGGLALLRGCSGSAC
jgi:hypothetical protein